MPKLQRSEEATKASYLTGIIKKYMEVEQMPYDKLAMKIRISESTLRNKLNGDNEFKYNELYRIFMLLRVPPEEILQCFCIRGESLWKCDTA